MFITTFGIRMPFNGWDAYVFLHISICAFKKQHYVFVLKVAHSNTTAADLFLFISFFFLQNEWLSIHRSAFEAGYTSKPLQGRVGIKRNYVWSYLTHSKCQSASLHSPHLFQDTLKATWVFCSFCHQQLVWLAENLQKTWCLTPSPLFYFSFQKKMNL